MNPDDDVMIPHSGGENSQNKDSDEPDLNNFNSEEEENSEELRNKEDDRQFNDLQYKSKRNPRRANQRALADAKFNLEQQDRRVIEAEMAKQRREDKLKTVKSIKKDKRILKSIQMSKKKRQNDNYFLRIQNKNLKIMRMITKSII